MVTLPHTLRVYRDDHMQHEWDYITVIDNSRCFATELLSVQVIEWTDAIIRLVEEIPCPDQSLLDGTATALDGWHYLLDPEDISAIQNIELLG